jgi:hypothetical protein
MGKVSTDRRGSVADYFQVQVAGEELSSVVSNMKPVMNEKTDVSAPVYGTALSVGERPDHETDLSRKAVDTPMINEVLT